MVAGRLGVVNVAAVEIATPPVESAYHETVPAGFTGKVAFNTTVPVPHLEESLASGAAGIPVIENITALGIIDSQAVVRFLAIAQ